MSLAWLLLLLLVGNGNAVAVAVADAVSLRLPPAGCILFMPFSRSGLNLWQFVGRETHWVVGYQHKSAACAFLFMAYY